MVGKAVAIMALRNPKVNPLDQLGDELAGLRADIRGVITRLPPVANSATQTKQNPPLSDAAIEELKQAWQAGAISDETMDEVDPDGLVEDDDTLDPDDFDGDDGE